MRVAAMMMVMAFALPATPQDSAPQILPSDFGDKEFIDILNQVVDLKEI